MITPAALTFPATREFDASFFFAVPGAGRSTSNYKKSQRIFCQGEQADTVCYILNGRVKLTVLSEQGKEAVVGLLEPGQFFGEACLNGHPLRTATTTAMDDCSIVAINKSVMLGLLRDDSDFAEFFMSYLLSRNSRIEEDLVDQLFNSSEKRLARLLLILARFDGEGSSRPFDIEISQETLAEMIGTTRSRVSFFMNKFRKLGFVSYDGHIQVHSSLLDAMLNEKVPLQRGA